MNDFEKKVFLEKTIGTDEGTLSLDTTLNCIDMWDSIGKLFVMSMIKKEFGRDVTPAEIRACETVADVLALMKKRE